MRSVLHDEKGHAALHTKFKNLYDVIMLQMSDRACLGEKALPFLMCQTRLEHFDSGLGLEIHVFTQIDLGEAAPSYETDGAIVTKLLAYAFDHLEPPLIAIARLQIPYLSIAKGHFCGIWIGIDDYTNFTRNGGGVIHICNVLPVYIQVNPTPLCYNCEQIGLIQASFNRQTRTLDQYFGTSLGND